MALAAERHGMASLVGVFFATEPGESPRHRSTVSAASGSA